MTLSDEDLRARLRRTDPLLADSATTAGAGRRTIGRLAPVAAAFVLVAGGVAIVWASDGDPAPGAPLELAVAAAEGPTMRSCLPFSVDVLADMPVSFAGTVTSEEAGSVTLHVDRWYRGDDADEVRLASPSGSVALDGIEFEEGGSYLVAATSGTVNACGFSGPATPELERAYSAAFAP
jgi:hypothetical protein